MNKLVLSEWGFVIRKPPVFLVLFLMYSVLSFSQIESKKITDSLQVVESQKVVKIDSVDEKSFKAKKSKFIPNPKRAALLSLAPGFGQIYNRKYAWIKVPIIYGGLVGLGFWANDRERYWLRLKSAYIKELAGEEHEFSGAGAALLLRERDAVDKTRQQAYITIGIVYIIQIVEAYVAAHLIDFDVDDDLSFRLKPSFENSPIGNMTGVGVVVEF